jgi:hypothetical protein
MTRATPPVPTIPMVDANSALHAWEVVEITGMRRALRAAINRGLAGLDGTWDQALLETRPLLQEIGTKCDRYRRSVDHLLAERELPSATDLDEAIAIVQTRPLGDQLVCHVGMAAVYAWAQATIDVLRASTDDPVEFLDGLEAALADRALMLYDLQQRDWEQAVARCKAPGVDLASTHPLPNPFGVGGGPCWHLTKIGSRRDG